MGSVTHIYDDKIELVKEVHRFARLGVRLEDSSKGGSMVHHNFESSLVVEVKSNKHLDPLLMELKGSILCSFNESYSQGGCGT